MKRVDGETWERRLSEQAESGETVKEYCKRRGIARSTFELKKKRAGAGFVELSEAERVEIELRNGALLRVSVRGLGKVLEALDGEG